MALENFRNISSGMISLHFLAFRTLIPNQNTSHYPYFISLLNPKTPSFPSPQTFPKTFLLSGIPYLPYPHQLYLVKQEIHYFVPRQKGGEVEKQDTGITFKRKK
jgi:hypothetical protein